MAVTRQQRRQVMERAGDRCEYCHMPADLDHAPFQVDHVRPQKHHGATVLENLGWACFPCNNRKACNPAGYDPETDQIEPLFNPRQHKWDDHFEWDGPHLRGKTAIGRATIDVLAINAPDRLAYRRELIQEGLFARLSGDLDGAWIGKGRALSPKQLADVIPAAVQFVAAQMHRVRAAVSQHGCSADRNQRIGAAVELQDVYAVRVGLDGDHARVGEHVPGGQREGPDVGPDVVDDGSTEEAGGTPDSSDVSDGADSDGTPELGGGPSADDSLGTSDGEVGGSLEVGDAVLLSVGEDWADSLGALGWLGLPAGGCDDATGLSESPELVGG